MGLALVHFQKYWLLIDTGLILSHILFSNIPKNQILKLLMKINTRDITDTWILSSVQIVYHGTSLYDASKIRKKSNYYDFFWIQLKTAHLGGPHI